MTKQNNLFRTAIIALLVLALASCSKTNKEGRMVPMNASFVMHINGAQMSSKMNWDEIKNSEAFKEAMADSTLPKYVMEALNNPDKSGIDLNKDFVMFVVTDKEGAYAGFTGSVKDAEKFNLFNLDATKGGFERQEGGVKYISNTPMIVGYNKETFVYLVNTPEMNSYQRRESGKDGKASRDMQQAIVDIFKLAENKSLAKNEKFSTLMKDNADMHIWINSEALAENMGDALPLVDLSKFTKGNINTFSIAFNNGNIAVKSRWYASNDLGAIIKKYKGDNLDESMVNKLPATGVNAAFAMNFKPEGIKEIIKLTGMEGLLSGLLKKETDFSMDDFIKANKGDLLVAVSNLRTKKESFTFGTGADAKEISYNRPDMDYVFVASINDKPSFNKIIQAGQEKMKLGSLDEMPDSVKSQLPVYSTNDKYFALGNTKSVVDAFLGGSNKNSDLIKLIGGNPIGGYADIQSLMKATEPDSNTDSTDRAAYEISLQMWDNAILKGGNIEDGALVIDFTINLKDKTTNSLKQLNVYAQKLSKLYQNKRKATMAEWQDTVPPPPAMSDEYVKPMPKDEEVPAPKK